MTYKECQNCKKVIKLRNLSLGYNLISCPLCGATNTLASISREQYISLYKERNIIGANKNE